jgi:hypothetical protein
MALLMALFFIGIALLIVGAMTTRTVNQSRHIDSYGAYENCMFGIESGLAQIKSLVETGGGVTVGLTADPELATGDAFKAFSYEDSTVSAQTMAGMPNLSYFSYAHNWSHDGVDNNGDGTVDEPQEQWVFSLFSASKEGATVRRAEEIVSGQDVNVWRNAIFAGTGQAGGLINGNVSIHGSVHLLGDNILPGGEAITAIDLSGTSLVHNNYAGMPADIASRVPPLPRETFGGEDVATLNAQLRVRHGLVGMSGNSEIGEPNIAGNGIKETMDGVYVTDGYTGTSVNEDGGRGDPTSLFSDNGWDESYDLGDRVPMPFLQDAYRSPSTGGKIWDNGRADWYTHEHYFDEVLVGDPSNPTDGIYNGNITIAANQNFYYNASRPADADPTHRLVTDDYILFDAASNRMQINGQITVNGSLTITRGSGNDKTISYSGRGAFLVHGNVVLNTDLLSVNANGTIANSFPANNCFGIMASGDMTVGALSQLTLMGAFYAQGRITCSRQSQIAGTFVSNYFDMGTNVPSIYQIPSLADNLPIGMIGAYPILAFSTISWRELQ